MKITFCEEGLTHEKRTLGHELQELDCGEASRGRETGWRSLPRQNKRKRWGTGKWIYTAWVSTGQI